MSTRSSTLSQVPASLASETSPTSLRNLLSTSGGKEFRKLMGVARERYLDRMTSGAWLAPLSAQGELLERLTVTLDQTLHETEIEACKASYEYFARRWLWIEHRATRELVLFDANQVQKRRRTTATAHDIILKARKEGISTDVSGEFFHAVLFTPRVRAVVLAHDESTVVTLFETPARFFDRLPPFLKPRTRYSNRRELIFSHAADGSLLDSHYIVGTAGNTDVGRGRDVDLLHLSEAAFYPNLESILSGIGEAMRPNAKARIETTYKFTTPSAAKFRELYHEALIGQNKWNVQFFAWFEDPEYRMATPPDFELTEEEQDLKERFSLDDSQLAWRRSKKRDLGADFESEYPATAQDAFKVRVGTARFSLDALELMRAKCRSPIHVEDNGALRIWEEPRPGRTYIIGADTSEGSERSTFCAAEVIEAKSGDQVASLNGRWPDHIYAHKLAELAKRYKDALIAVERNNTGYSIINSLMHVENYHVLFEDHDKKLGWSTDGQSRPVMLDVLDKAIFDGWWVVRDEDLINELQTVVYYPDRKPRAAAGYYDDRVFAAGIALCARQERAPARFDLLLAGVSIGSMRETLETGLLDDYRRESEFL